MAVTLGDAGSEGGGGGITGSHMSTPCSQRNGIGGACVDITLLVKRATPTLQHTRHANQMAVGISRNVCWKPPFTSAVFLFHVHFNNVRGSMLDEDQICVLGRRCLSHDTRDIGYVAARLPIDQMIAPAPCATPAGGAFAAVAGKAATVEWAVGAAAAAGKAADWAILGAPGALDRVGWEPRVSTLRNHTHPVASVSCVQKRLAVVMTH
jgi:hypothetical protein